MKKDLRSTRIDGEGRWFCRQRLVTLNRLFASNRIKILKELLVEYKFHIFYCVLTRSVIDSCCFTISVCAVLYFLYLEKYKQYRTRGFNEILVNTVAVALNIFLIFNIFLKQHWPYTNRNFFAVIRYKKSYCKVGNKLKWKVGSTQSKTTSFFLEDVITKM